jgi:hypothetical protein
VTFNGAELVHFVPEQQRVQRYEAVFGHALGIAKQPDDNGCGSGNFGILKDLTTCENRTLCGLKRGLCEGSFTRTCR